MINPNDVVRLKAPIQIDACTKGRVCGATRDGRDQPLLVAIWVRLGDGEVELIDPANEGEAV